MNIFKRMFTACADWLRDLTDEDAEEPRGLAGLTYVITREFSDSVNLRHSKCQHEFNVLRKDAPPLLCPICRQP